MRYRRKPPEIEAIQYLADGSNWREIDAFIGGCEWSVALPMMPIAKVPTPCGIVELHPGDWVRRDNLVSSAVWVSKDEVFSRVYEPVTRENVDIDAYVRNLVEKKND